jgi:predicted nucleic acid-binding protein
VTFLLDTNVVSELRKVGRDERVLAWFGGVDAEELHVSTLAIGEIRRGIDLLRHRGDRRQAAVLEPWFQSLKADFAERTIAVSTPIAERWGQLDARTPLSPIDGLMAATALVHDLIFVTRDTAGVAGTGVRVIDPWLA